MLQTHFIIDKQWCHEHKVRNNENQGKRVKKENRLEWIQKPLLCYYLVSTLFSNKTSITAVKVASLCCLKGTYSVRTMYTFTYIESIALRTSTQSINLQLLLSHLLMLCSVSSLQVSAGVNTTVVVNNSSTLFFFNWRSAFPDTAESHSR